MSWQWTSESRSYRLELLGGCNAASMIDWVKLFCTFRERYPTFNGDEKTLKNYLKKCQKQLQSTSTQSTLLFENADISNAPTQACSEFEWTDDALEYLQSCLKTLQAANTTYKQSLISLYQMFMKLYPQYPYTNLALYRFAKRKVKPVKYVPCVTTKISKQMEIALLKAYETAKSDLKTHKNMQAFIYSQFVSEFTTCSLNPSELLAEAVSRYFKVKRFMPSLQSSSEEFQAKWSTNCNSVLIHVITMLKRQFKKFNSTSEEDDYVINEFRSKYPFFTGQNNIIIQKYRGQKSNVRTPTRNWTTENFDESLRNLDNVTINNDFQYFRILGQKLSRNAVFNFMCHNCGFLFEVVTGGTSHKISRLDKPLSDPPKVVAMFSHIHKLLPQYYTSKQKFVVCKQCLSGKSIHKLYPIRNTQHTNIDIPQVLRRLTQKEVGLISLSGVYSNIIKYDNAFRRVFEHRQGKVEIGNRSLQKYADILMYYNLKPQHGERKDYIVEALQWLKIHNHLYSNFYSNYETLLPWLSNSQAPINAYNILAYKGDFKECVGKDIEGIAILAEDITIDPKSVSGDRVYGWQHPMDALNNLKAITKVSYNDPNLEARAFPKEFPYGLGSFNGAVGGMDPQIYVKYRLLNADPRWRNNNSFAFMWLNKLIFNRLIYFNNVGRVVQQQNLLKPLIASEVYSNFNLGSVVPTTIPGSKNYWNARVLDLVAATKAFGPPQLFVTLTHNDNWYEIQSALGNDILSDDPTGFDEPAKNLDPSNSVPIENVMAFVKLLIVFKQKFLSIGTRGPFGIVRHFYYRFEYQKRGALHVHMVVWVYEGTLPKDVVVAEYPRASVNNNDKAEVAHLRRLVTEFQLHSCYPERCHRISKGKYIKTCKYGFPFYLQDDITMDKNKLRYQYRRSSLEDLLVVPYNRQLLLLWGGHINVQLTTNVHFEKYLAKYVAKCEPSVKAKGAHNEVDRFLNYRTMGILECITTLLQYHQSQASYKVIFLPTEFSPQQKMLKRFQHLPSDCNSENVYYENLFEKYLNRPESLTSLSYEKYFQLYEIRQGKVLPSKDLLESEDELEPSTAATDTQIMLLDKIGRHIKERTNLAVTRFRFILPYGPETENFYEQKLCLSGSWTHNDVDTRGFKFSPENVTKTYMEECCIRKLVNSEQDAMAAITAALDRGFNVSRVFEIAKQMISHKLLTEEKVDKMLEPLLSALGVQDMDEVLQDISVNSCNSIVDLFANIPAYEKVEEYKAKMNMDQLRSLEWFESKIKKGNQILAICSGSGGVGKSFMLNALTVLFRSKKFIVAITATTGAAAYLVGGKTLHSFLRVNYDMKCCIQQGTTEALILKDTDVLIVDEFSMLENEMFILLDETLRKFSNEPYKLFGNKSVILFGDPGQLDAIRQSLFCNPLLYNFTIIVLHQIVRQQDTEFAALMNRTRLAKNTKEDFDVLSTRYVHPSSINFNEEFIIICALRLEVKFWNNLILEKHNGEVFRFVAHDLVNELSPNEFEQQLIKTCCKYRMDDVLELKAGCTVILTRNIDVDAGWANGTRCKVITCNQANKYVIVESIRDKSRRPITPVSQKLSFTAGDSDYKFVTRTQIPLRLGYATTVHSVQGSTLECKVYIQLNSSFWASGQAYVACRRLKNIDQLHFLSLNFETILCDEYTTTLITWMDEANILNNKRDLKSGRNFPLQQIKKVRPFVPESDQLLDISNQLAVINKPIALHDTSPKAKSQAGLQETIGTRSHNDNIPAHDADLTSALSVVKANLNKNSKTAENTCFGADKTNNENAIKTESTKQSADRDTITSVLKRTFDPCNSIPQIVAKKQKQVDVSLEDTMKSFCNYIFDQINVLLPMNIETCAFEAAVHHIHIIRDVFDPHVEQMRLICIALSQKDPHLYANQVVDQVSTTLLPNCFKEQVCSIKTTGDGNCLYRSFSWTLFGCESFYKVFKVAEAFHLLYDSPEIWNAINQLQSPKYVFQVLADNCWASDSNAFNLCKILNRPVFWYGSFHHHVMNQSIHVVSQYVVNNALCRNQHMSMLGNISQLQRIPVMLHFIPIYGRGRQNHFVPLLRRTVNSQLPEPFRGVHCDPNMV